MTRGGGAQAGFPREGGRRAGPKVGGSLRPPASSTSLSNSRSPFDVLQVRTRLSGRSAREGEMGEEPREGSGLSRGRGPRAYAPPPVRACPPGKSLWAKEALSKQRNAAWNPGDGGGEEGGGGAAEAARPPASPPASPGELSPTPAGAAAARRGRRLGSEAVFQFTYADPGEGGERLLHCPSWLRRTQP